MCVERASVLPVSFCLLSHMYRVLLLGILKTELNRLQLSRDVLELVDTQWTGKQHTDHTDPAQKACSYVCLPSSLYSTFKAVMTHFYHLSDTRYEDHIHVGGKNQTWITMIKWLGHNCLSPKNNTSKKKCFPLKYTKEALIYFFNIYLFK